MKTNNFGLQKKGSQVSVLLQGISRPPGYRVVQALGVVFKAVTIILWLVAGIFALLALVGR